MAITNKKRRLTAILTCMVLVLSMFFINISKVNAGTISIDGAGRIVSKDYSNKTKDERQEGKVDVNQLGNGLFGELRIYLQGFTGIALITLTLAFVIKCAQLGAAADNSQKRAMHTTGLLWIGICVGLLGAFNTVMNILQSLSVLTTN